MSQVVILHGWSDTSKSFTGLVRFLRQNGFETLPIWLGDYISLDDDVAIKDVAKRMKAVLDEKLASGELEAPFDMIVHSTGGLVAREWLTSYYNSAHPPCPLKRLLMLAPANFGSRLASMGQSMIGRLVKGWNNWFHTGKRMLENLELSSPYLWDLVKRDLLSPKTAVAGQAIYGETGVWPFVIVGSRPYTSPLRSILNEQGGDGTVRVSAANMNALGATIDFAHDEEEPDVIPWRRRVADTWATPLAVVADHDHGSITSPETDSELATLILQALRCGDANRYRQIAATWNDLTERTALQGLLNPADASSLPAESDAANFHQFMQVNVHVMDDHGEDVPDFFLEFFALSSLRTSNKLMAYFHKEVLQHVHVNGQNSAYRCLYVDRTDLYKNFYAMIPEGVEKKLWMSISAAPLGDNVSYFRNYKTGAAGQVLAHQFEDAALIFRLRRNTTHFVEIVIPRTPRENVFKLTRG